MVATDMNESDCEAFIGVLFRNLSSKSQSKKRISEYIFFQSKTVGRIPYDSEIAYFLETKLNITPSSFKNSLGQDDMSKFETIVMRIHDSCCMGLFQIKLKRRNKPSNGKHSWKKQLTREEKEVFGDPSLVLHPVKKKPKNYCYYQPSDRQVKVVTQVEMKESDNEVTQKNIHEQKTPTIEMFPNAENDPIIQELKLDKPSKTKPKPDLPKVQVTKTTLTASLNKASSFSKPIERAQKNTSTQGGSSNNTSYHQHSSSSWIFPNKAIPQKTPFSESIRKKNSFLKATVVPPANSSNGNKSTAKTHQSQNNLQSKSTNNDESTDFAKSSNNEINQEWKQKFILNRTLCDFNIPSESLPPSWTSSEGGCHPLLSSLDEVQKAVRATSIIDLRTICENDLKDQIVEAEYEDDDYLIEELEFELESYIGGPSLCRVDLNEFEMLKFLKAVHQENIIWDVGFQMNHLKHHCKTSVYRNRNLTTKCYCPCSNYMKKWRKHMEIDSILGQSGAMNCKKRGVFQCPDDLYAHLQSLSGSCLLHRAFAMYLRHLYPEQIKKKKYEVIADGAFDFKPRTSNSVSLPLSIKNIPVNLTLFEIKR